MPPPPLRPLRDRTPPSGEPNPPPLHSVGRAPTATSQAVAAHQPPGPPRGSSGDHWCFNHPVSVPRPRNARRSANTRKSRRPGQRPHGHGHRPYSILLSPPPLAVELALATAMSFLPAKNFIFLQDTKNNLKFLVDSGTSQAVAAAPKRRPLQTTHNIVHHIYTGSAAHMFARPRRLDRVKTPHRRRGIPRHGESRYYSPLQLTMGIPTASGSQEGGVVPPPVVTTAT